MNLVIAVILEGYTEGKNDEEAKILERCFMCWEKRDPDLHLSLPIGEAIAFINEVTGEEVLSVDHVDPSSRLGVNLAAIPLRSAAGMLDLRVREDGTVHYVDASKQVLRFMSLGTKHSDLKDAAQCAATDLAIRKIEEEYWRRNTDEAQGDPPTSQ